jgi:hypothetical protein
MLLKDYKEENTTGIKNLSIILCEQAVKEGWLVKVEHKNLKFGSGTIHPYFQKNAAASLLVILENNVITLNSGYRTLAQQYILKKNLTTLVAKVGNSNHGSGLAIDIDEWEKLETIFQKNGWIHPYKSDLVHFDYNGIDKRQETVKLFQRYWNIHNKNSMIVVDGIVGNQVMNSLANTPINGF